MKALAVIFALTSWGAFGQSPTPNHLIIKDEFNKEKIVKVATTPQVLIIEGDSIYNVTNDNLLIKIMEGKGSFKIINNQDSILAILKHRIKAIFIIEAIE